MYIYYGLVIVHEQVHVLHTDVVSICRLGMGISMGICVHAESEYIGILGGL